MRPNQVAARIRSGAAALLFLGTGCAAHATSPQEPPSRLASEADAEPPTCHPARDRAAILKMAGTFRVSFSFEEVEALAPGYRLRDPYRTSGTEVVMVLEDVPGRVSLQHVLLIPEGPGSSFPLKHWRQDWTFEDPWLLAYQGKEIFRNVETDPAAVRCAWSQAVYQVDDGPRYESHGRFEHAEDSATWTSERTNRPLPRRESSRASEYDLLAAINTHVIREDGWTHLEDNLKWVLATESALVRERGENRYVRISLANEQVARAYLARTGGFWADARAEWTHALSKGDALRVAESVDGKALVDVMLPLADELATAPSEQRREAIRGVLDRHVEVIETP